MFIQCPISWAYLVLFVYVTFSQSFHNGIYVVYLRWGQTEFFACVTTLISRQKWSCKWQATHILLRKRDLFFILTDLLSNTRILYDKMLMPMDDLKNYVLRHQLRQIYYKYITALLRICLIIPMCDRTNKLNTSHNNIIYDWLAGEKNDVIKRGDLLWALAKLSGLYFSKEENKHDEKVYADDKANNRVNRCVSCC